MPASSSWPKTKKYWSRPEPYHHPYPASGSSKPPLNPSHQFNLPNTRCCSPDWDGQGLRDCPFHARFFLGVREHNGAFRWEGDCSCTFHLPTMLILTTLYFHVDQSMVWMAHRTSAGIHWCRGDESTRIRSWMGAEPF